MHCPHGEETGEVLLLVPHHHAVAHEVPQLGLDLLLDGVGGDVLTPAGDDHILDPTWVGVMVEPRTKLNVSTTMAKRGRRDKIVQLIKSKHLG